MLPAEQLAALQVGQAKCVPAYSEGTRTLIPIEGDHALRQKAATDSDRAGHSWKRGRGHACGASEPAIARTVGVGRTTVAEYLRRTAVIGITWPIPPEVDDAELERRLFAPAGFNKPPARIMPDWTHIHAELRRRGVTLELLWEE